MAFTSTMHWDVRPAGNDTNGGGFDTAATGTDYSQQDAAQITYTDLVIGTTTTQLTSAANPFTSAHVGNVINVTGGTGFTVQRVLINSVAGSTATCDKSCGTASSTGGTGRLGGGLALPTTPPIITGNYIWVKAGTYTVTATVGGNVQYSLIGYSATHGDNAALPTITTATNSIDLVTAPNNTSLPFRIQNITLTNTAATPANAIRTAGGSGTPFVVSNVIIGATFTNGINTAGTAIVSVQDCTILSPTSSAVVASGATGVILRNCVIRGCGGIGVSVANGSVYLTNTIVAAGTNVGVSFPLSGAAGLFYNCTIANHTGGASHGITAGSSLSGTLIMENCIVYGNGGFGVNANPDKKVAMWLMRANAWGSNTGGNYPAGLGAGSGDVTLTANPFTNSGTGDYSLNATAGGGLACRNAGYQWS